MGHVDYSESESISGQHAIIKMTQLEFYILWTHLKQSKYALRKECVLHKP